MAVRPIPEGYPQVIPYLAIDGAAEAIKFYTLVLGATETVRMGAPGGKVGHAELKIGDSVIMLADEFEDMGHVSPKKLGGSPVSICVYLDNVDDVYAKAIKAGATELQPVEDKFYGDRAGSFKDPFGHAWNVMTHVEDVPPEEMQQRAAKAMEEMGA